MSEDAPLDQISHWLSLQSGGAPAGLPSAPTGPRLDADESHAMSEDGEVCLRCGNGIRWPAIEDACPVKVTSGVMEEWVARAILHRELDDFFAWWRLKEHDPAPDQRSWTAEFFEWTKLKSRGLL